MEPWIEGLWKELSNICVSQLSSNVFGSEHHEFCANSSGQDGTLLTATIESEGVVAVHSVASDQRKTTFVSTLVVNSEIDPISIITPSFVKQNGETVGESANGGQEVNLLGDKTSAIATLLPEQVLTMKLDPTKSATNTQHNLKKLETSGFRLPIDSSWLDGANELSGLPSLPALQFQIQFINGEAESGVTRDLTSINFDEDAVVAATSTSSSQLHPFIATIKAVKCLTSPEAQKRTLLMQLDVGGADWTYEPGDSFGILCPNEPGLVLAICNRLELNPIALISLEHPTLASVKIPCSIFMFLRYHVDLCSTPRRHLYRLMAEFTEDLAEKRMLMFLCSKEGSLCFSLLTHHHNTKVFHV